jgi:hypothetical protein
MKTLINQNKTGIFTVNNNQFINMSKVVIDEIEWFSIGVENISFGLYQNEKQSKDEFDKLIDFLGSANNQFYFSK